MLKVGVLGAGHLGKIHLKLLKELKKDYEVIGFYDPDRENAKKVNREFRVKAFKKIEDLINESDVENEGLFVAVWTGLEPATPCVTGMYSNQLNYQTVFIKNSFLQKRCKYKLFFQLAKHLFYKKSC